MPTQAIAGFRGKMYTSNDGGVTWRAVAEVNKMTISISMGELEASSFDSNGWKEFIPGMKEWEADFEGMRVIADASQTDIYNALVNGTTIKIRMFPKDGSGNKGYEGNAFVTSWEIKQQLNDPVPIAGKFRGTGALTEVIAP